MTILNERGGDVYGKILVLTFEDNEEEILNHIISYVSTGVKVFQEVEYAKTNLSFDVLEIDDINRSVRKVHCYECKVGYYKHQTLNCKKNYCFICDNCGDRLTVEPNVEIR